jgi:hypothetical protein
MSKSIEELKSWSDLADYAPMVLFNNWNSINDGAIMEEWQEQHYATCPYEQARYKIEDLAESTKKKDIKERKALIDEYGEDPSCSCEMYQTFIIDIDEWTFDKLKELYDLDIFYSDVIDNYIINVYHFGTSWRIMGLKGGYVNV